MEEPHQLEIKAGTELVIHTRQNVDGFPARVAVERLEHGLVWIKAASEDLEVGDFVIIEQPISGDARYLSPGEVEVAAPDQFAVLCENKWERTQQRNFFRITTHRIRLEVRRPEPEKATARPSFSQRRSTSQRREPSTPRTYAMVDLSAGGTCFDASTLYEVGESVTCCFELPGEGAFELRATVVRADPPRRHGSRHRRTSVEFDEDERSSRPPLLRWTFAEQVRRHRLEKRRQRS